MKETMDKAAFEAAISAYTDKIVEEDSQLVKYVMSKSVKTVILNRDGDIVARTTLEPSKVGRAQTKRPVGARPKRVITPLGKFDDITQASNAHNVSIDALRGRIRYARQCGNKDYYVEKNSDGPT